MDVPDKQGTLYFVLEMNIFGIINNPTPIS